MTWSYILSSVTRSTVLTLFAWLAAQPALAQGKAAEPVVYSRSQISIVTQPLPVKEEEKETKEKAETDKAAPEEAPPPATQPVIRRFDVDIRPFEALNASGIYTLADLASSQGLMFVLPQPDIAVVEAPTVYQAVDLLFIDAHGRVSQIFPQITLAGLNAPIEPSKPAKALLLLRAGACESLHIQPGDEVRHSVFSPALKVIE